MLKLAGLATATALAAFATVEGSLFTSTVAVSPIPANLVPALDPDLPLRGALARAGLGFEELVAAGVTTAQIAPLIELARESDVVQLAQLGPADVAVAEAQGRVVSLEKAIRGGDREPATLAALATARTDVESALSAREQLLDGLFADATGNLAPAVVQRLQQIKTNARYRRLPIEFLVVERTAAEWADLRECLTHERVCARRGDMTDPAQVASLAAARARAEVAAASQRGEAGLASAETAWLAASTL